MPRHNTNARRSAKAWKRFQAIPRKRIRPLSKKRASLKRIYASLRREFLAKHFRCQCCTARGLTPKVAIEVHHSRGRIGRLLIDVRFFKALCGECHDWCHKEIAAARAIGMFCPVGQWNTVPRE